MPHWNAQAEISASILTQKPTKVPGKVADKGPSTWVHATTCESQKEFLAPGFHLVQPWLL